MYYIIYLIGIGLFLLKGIGFSNLSYFIDSTTLILLIVPCFLMMFCTKSLKSFGECFLFTFGKRNDSLLKCKKCLRSIKVAISAIVISGIIEFMIALVNMLHSPYRSSGSLELLGLDISVSLLSIFYALILCILLLPVYVILKQHLMQLLSEADEAAEQTKA